MKQLITVCLTVFFMAGLQDMQAQTKEETIEWLKVYGNQLFSDSDYNITKIDDNGDILLEINLSNYTRYYQFNLANDYWLESIYHIEKKLTLSPKENIRSWVSNGYDGNEYGQWIVEFRFHDEESCNRFYNAIIHLAKLLGTKSLPKKDTF